MLPTPFKVAVGSETIQADSSCELSFMMQILTGDYPASPWVTVSFTFWFYQAGPVLQRLGCKHCSRLHFIYLKKTNPTM